jgi:penicillin amidase
VNEFQGYWLLTLRRWLERGEPAWLAGETPRAQIIAEALAGAVRSLETLSDAADQWQWGRIHQITFRHDLGRVEPLDMVFNLGPYPADGDSFTVWQTDLSVEEANGVTASSRFLVDLGPAAHGWALLIPGQSGQVGSSHYGDLVEPWRVGDYFPLLWEEEEVTAVSRSRLILTPPLS